jgi:hypothetical protein
MLYKQYYSELGKMLYALASVDGTITAAEKKALHDIVRNELAPAEKNRDEFGTDAAWYAEIEFDILDETVTDPSAAFASFLGFLEDHQTAVTVPMMESARRIAARLAASFRGTNRKEQALLAELDRKLNALIDTKRVHAAGT